MSVLEIILTVLIASAAVGVIGVMIRNKKRGKGSCSCGCSGCAVSDCPRKKQ